MALVSFGEERPLVPTQDGVREVQNRRVEIFVLAPDAVVAGWDPNWGWN